MKVMIGTNNPSKVAVVKRIFEEILKEDIEVTSINAKSGVPETPIDEETYRGAYNRATECSKSDQADFYVGIESGMINRYGHDFEEAWAVIMSQDFEPLIGYSSGLILPKEVLRRMNKGFKHHEVMGQIDEEFNLHDNRDTWSRYTSGDISREVSLEEALRNALLQISNPKSLYHYKPKD